MWVGAATAVECRMRALPSWVKGFVYSFLCIFTLAQTGFGQGPAAASAYGKLPLSFEPNQGQSGGATDFVARGQGYTLLLNSSATTLALHRPRPAGDRDRREAERGAMVFTAPPVALQLRLLGANVSAEAVAEDLLPGKSNYLIGNDRTHWRTNVANYGRVRYRGVYPGIDVVYYGNQRLLEHDFEVAPGADPRKIRLAFDGATSAEIAASGDLVLHVADGEVRLHKPLIYQQTPQGKREIAGGFKLRKHNNEVTFQVGDYDRSKALVIDPTLAYSTYLGGSSYDYGFGIAVDSGGNAYVTGYTGSTDFPGTAASFSGALCSGCSHVFVTKLNSTGTATVYSTYFGGNGHDYGQSIAVDSSGNAYLTGITGSSNFPLAGSAFQGTLNGFYNSFVTVLNAAGTGLLYSTFLGGSGQDWGYSIALDGGANPNIYVAGQSYSSDFPVVGTPISTAPPVLYHSNNGASSWLGGTNFPSLSVQMIAVDGGTPGSVYAAGWAIGVYKSTDGGNTWAPTALTRTYVQSHALVIDPTTTGTSATLYAGNGSTVYRLTSGGSTLASFNVGACCANALALNPNNSAQLYVGTSSQGVWVSSNANGASPSFTQLTTTGLIISPYTTPPSINALAVDKTTGALYAGTSRGVFQLPAGGTSWNAFSNGLPSSTYIYALVEDASSNLYASNYSTLYTTSTASAAWVSISGSGSSALPYGSTNVAVDPLVAGTIYAGGYNGLFKTTNGGATWALSNSGVQQKLINALAVDPVNSINVYVGTQNIMAFVAKFSAAGSAIYSAQYGGMGDTWSDAGAADSSGNFYVGGYTDATGIPGPLVGQTTFPGTFTGSVSGFLVKINSTGGVAYDRYLGGSMWDYVAGVAVDGSGNVYLTGESDSTDFPVTASAYQSTNKSGGTAFLTKIDPTGANLLYSTFLGGTYYEYGNAIALVNANGRVAIAGETYSTDFPTVNAKQPFNAGSNDGFYAQFDTTLSGAASLLYSTYLGGSSYDYPYALAIDSAGSAYIAGYTGSTDFPVTASALQTTLAGTTNQVDAFITKFQSTGHSSDLALTIAPSATTVAAGASYTYTITVTNNGPSTLGAPNVRISDALPSNLTLVSAGGTISSGGSFTCTPASGTGVPLLCNVGLLPNAASATLTLTVTAAVPAINPFPNTAQVSTDDDDPNPTNNSAATLVTVQALDDLMVTNATTAQQASGYSPTTLVDHTLATDWFNITNNGAGNAPGVTVTIPVPAGVTFNGSGNSTPCTLSSSTVTCSVGTIAAGATSPVLFRWTPTAPGTVTITATVSSSQVIDSNPANNSAFWTTTVNPAVDLSITAALSSVNVPVGGSAAIALTIRNLGTDTATSPSVTTTLPAGMSYVSFSSSSTGVSCSVDGPVFCSLPNLAPNANLTVTIFATAVLQGTYSATSSVSFSGTDTNTSNNTATTLVTFTGGLNSSLTTLLTDYETSTLQAYSGYPNPAPACCGQPTQVGANPSNVEIAPNGRLAFTGNVNGSYISVVDLTIQAEIARIRDVGGWSIAITSDGQKLVSVSSNRDELDVVDIATLAADQDQPRPHGRRRRGGQRHRSVLTGCGRISGVYRQHLRPGDRGEFRQPGFAGHYNRGRYGRFARASRRPPGRCHSRRQHGCRLRSSEVRRFGARLPD